MKPSTSILAINELIGEEQKGEKETRQRKAQGMVSNPATLDPLVAPCDPQESFGEPGLVNTLSQQGHIYLFIIIIKDSKVLYRWWSGKEERQDKMEK